MEGANLSREQQEQYVKGFLNYCEWKSTVDTARDEGLQQGLLKGRENEDIVDNPLNYSEFKF